MTKETVEARLLKRFEKKVAEFQEGYHTEMESWATQAKSIATGKREYLYGAIQEAYCIGSELRLPENRGVLDKLLSEHGLSTEVREGTNPWMPITNLLFGRWVTGEKGGRYFEVDKSAKKYAVSFRYFEEHQWEPELVADNLRDPKTGKLNSFGKLDGKQQRGLVGTEKWGRHEHRSDDPDEGAEEFGRDVLWSLGKPLAIIRGHFNNHAHDTNQYVALWGIHRGGDQLAVYGEMVGGSYSRGVEAYLRKAAKEVLSFGDKVASGKAVGKGNRPPQLVGQNVSGPMLQAMVKQLKQTAAEFQEMAGEALANSNKTNDSAEVERLLGASQECKDQRAEVLEQIARVVSYLERSLPIELEVSTPLSAPEKPKTVPEKSGSRRSVKVGGKVQVEREAAHAA
jgi:hypothetical protein